MPQRQLVFRLEERQRTPVFRINYGDTTRYSWFLRLPYTRPIHHSLAGVVRLETPEIGAGAAIELANLTSYHLPVFASKPQHDPRAPQNLLPVGAPRDAVCATRWATPPSSGAPSKTTSTRGG